MPQDEDPIDQKLFLLTSSWPGPQRGIVSVPSYGEGGRLGHQHRRRVPSKGKKIAVIIAAGTKDIKNYTVFDANGGHKAVKQPLTLILNLCSFRLYVFCCV